MELSVIYFTYRPGGYDILADSLKNQTIRDYELIIVDDYRVDRRRMVRDYLEYNDVCPSYIGRSKPKCFPETTYGLINAWNTGILASTGDVIVLLGDYTWLPPDSLERFLEHEDKLKKNIAISGVAKYYHTEVVKRKKNLEHPISIWKRAWMGDPGKNGWGEHHMWMPPLDQFELFYAAIPYDLLVLTNGFSEVYDFGLDQLDSFVKRVREVNGGFYVDVDNICQMVDHRRWEPGWLWHMTKITPSREERPDVTLGNCFDLKTHRRGNIFWEEK